MSDIETQLAPDLSAAAAAHDVTPPPFSTLLRRRTQRDRRRRLAAGVACGATAAALGLGMVTSIEGSRSGDTLGPAAETPSGLFQAALQVRPDASSFTGDISNRRDFRKCLEQPGVALEEVMESGPPIYRISVAGDDNAVAAATACFQALPDSRSTETFREPIDRLESFRVELASGISHGDAVTQLESCALGLVAKIENPQPIPDPSRLIVTAAGNATEIGAVERCLRASAIVADLRPAESN